MNWTGNRITGVAAEFGIVIVWTCAVGLSWWFPGVAGSLLFYRFLECSTGLVLLALLLPSSRDIALPAIACFGLGSVGLHRTGTAVARVPLVVLSVLMIGLFAIGLRQRHGPRASVVGTVVGAIALGAACGVLVMTPGVSASAPVWLFVVAGAASGVFLRRVVARWQSEAV
ncbi:MAG: hypothetical protein U0228_06085 [Myxococcaceae bacterium]